MRKALLVPLKDKEQLAVTRDMALSPQQRVANMFELMAALHQLQQHAPLIPKDEFINLKKRPGGVLS